MIALLEVLGLMASVAALAVVWRARRSSRVLRLTVTALLGILALGHLANVLEAYGFTWADTTADQFSALVPVMWGLFLLETGRSYLSERLRASDEQVRFFLEAVPAAVAWLDADSALLGYSDAWRSSFPKSEPGAKLEQVVGAPLPELGAALARCLRGEAQGMRPLQDETAELSDGQRRYFRWALRPWAHPDRPQPGAILILEDVTAQREAEARRGAAAEELARMQRLAHVGQMAAGAAHDFNNFLQVIHSALWELEGNPSSTEARANIETALDAARDLTRSMLRFGGGSSVQPAPLDLLSLLREMQGPLSYALGRNHRLEVSLPRVDSVTIEGRAPRLQQALLNLAVNARDAMPSGGPIQLGLAVEGEEAVLSVRDFGTGMTEDVRSQLFTPFFTTKGQLGSGLGLNVVQTVVEEHRGRISVESALDLGTTFRLRLPLSAAPLAS
jgi:two-component system cell cycle sensor histidine kinase/response regulator CckA